MCVSEGFYDSNILVEFFHIWYDLESHNVDVYAFSIINAHMHKHTTQLKAVKASNKELQQSLVKAVKAIDKLSAEKATMGSQLEQQAL